VGKRLWDIIWWDLIRQDRPYDVIVAFNLTKLPKVFFFIGLDQSRLICSNFAWLKRNSQISKSFYLLTNYAKNRTILS